MARNMEKIDSDIHKTSSSWTWRKTAVNIGKEWIPSGETDTSGSRILGAGCYTPTSSCDGSYSIYVLKLKRSEFVNGN
ncbi:uncharacterized protein RCO7_04063 [Rhynchosporium graminicola]|uniref:Uncharacterized protein n=1 Tax=Rhynchosporium graminicola TaxID=2792576 RepID=A0A1E1LFA4_9HELO|nr:uncharacterized protein RCO7_04063 [Rhynchosporium commune]